MVGVDSKGNHLAGLCADSQILNEAASVDVLIDWSICTSRSGINLQEHTWVARAILSDNTDDVVDVILWNVNDTDLGTTLTECVAAQHTSRCGRGRDRDSLVRDTSVELLESTSNIVCREVVA